MREKNTLEPVSKRFDSEVYFALACEVDGVAVALRSPLDLVFLVSDQYQMEYPLN